jgi:hypothetical protein
VNYDPLRFCRHGSHLMPREGFRVLPGVKNKREVCERCYERVMAEREKRKSYVPG